ncbi:hypothetical protein [Caballeronia glebae]|uniref:hypothetical protein n=1 Tax=Caballeronia glebae TaxID=1777143 RepID=UPI0038B7523C
MHLPHHQKLLQRTAPDQIDGVIAQIRAENPSAFLVEHNTAGASETLSSRVFFDQPMRNEPCKGFMNFCPPRAA